ncbi:MAG: diacylglycerol/lipid kinase family protein [Candidatus Cryptobacteroides sp.]
MTPNDRIWYAVVNPNAGSGKTVSEWPRASKILSDNRIEFEYRTTWKMGAAVEITMKACAEGYRKFLAVGGDGTVHEVLEGISKYVEMSDVASTLDDGLDAAALEDFTLAVMPIGSGNDWIKTLGIPKDFNRVAELMKAESLGRQDVFRLDLKHDNASMEIRSYMANVGGVGFDANVCKKVNFEKNSGKSGKILYLKALISNILNFKTFDCAVEADGKEIFRGTTMSIALGAGKYSGGGMLQVPDAVLDDGLLDVTVIPLMPLHRIIRAVPGLFTGTLLKRNPELISTKCSSLKIRPLSSPAPIVEVDGEVVGNLPVSIHKLDGQVKVLRNP